MLVVVALLAVNVNAGVGFKNVISASPGEIVNEFIRLQNLAEGNPDLEYTGKITSGGEIISFVEGSEYSVPNGEIVDAPIRVSVPSDARIGQVYTINMVFKSIPVSADKTSGNAVQFTKTVGISFDVEVVEAPTPPAPTGIGGGTIGLIIGIIIIIVIIWYVLKKRGESSSSS